MRQATGKLDARSAEPRPAARSPGPATGFPGALALIAAALLVAAPAAATPTAKQLYDEARAAEARLRSSEELMAARGAWVRAADRYQAVVRNWPRSGYCDDALRHRGVLLREAATRFDHRDLAVSAINAFNLLANGYPSSKWAPAALLELVQLYLDPLDDRVRARRAGEQLARVAPGTDMARKAAAALAPPAPPPVVAANPPRAVLDVRHWVGDSHTRVVIDLDGVVPHTEGRLSDPERVFLDFQGARLSEELAARVFPIEGSHLTRIRVGNRDPDVVRVVLDFGSVTKTNIFALPNPYRVVVDSEGERPVVAEGSDPERTGPSAARTPVDSGGAPPAPEPTEGGYSIARQFGAGVRRIVLDAGHGGKDPGTRSGSLHEKDLALDISKRVRDLLEKDGFEVVMTRETDIFIPLEKRAFIANDGEADLFVSIHANAARNRNARGLETYYLNFATSPDAEAVAARENASAGGVPMAQVPRLVQQIMNNNRVEESRALATSVQEAMVADLLDNPESEHNRGVKTAGFHVLLGARMPAILLEIGFVSNRAEARLLRQSRYRGELAEAIAKGIRTYVRTLGQDVTATANGPQPD